MWHGGAHSDLAIGLPIEKTIFVYAVILIAPLVAAALVWTRFRLVGVWLFFLAMLGAFLFGVYHHYILVSPDNIHHLPAGNPESQNKFVASAAVIGLLELISTLFGAYEIGVLSEARSARTS